MKFLAALLSGLVLAGLALAREPGFGEYRAVQESLSRVHPRMRASWLRARGLDDSYYTTFRRPESTGLVCVGRWPWGPSWELAGRDTFLYLGSGSGVRILSIADSVQPRMLGQINARGLVSQVVVQDSLLFVACGSWGAQIYSVSDPANPRELGSLDAVIGDLCVKDTFCYAVGGDSLRIYNVASPIQPSLVGAIRDSGDLVVVANGYAFSAGRWVMNIYNVTDPAHPTWANSRGGPAYAMFVRRNLLFCSSVQPDNMTVLNISDPLNIVQVSQVAGYGGEGLYVDDSYAYLSCTYGHSGLFVIDVSDSARPAMRDSINPEGVEEWEPYVPRSPGYGYLADAHGGLVTVDLHDVNSISEAWSGYKADKAIDVHIDGHLAYIADDLSGLQIVDISDPERPSSVGLFDVVGTRETYTAEARDSFAFIGWWGSNRRFLRVLDVTDPSSPLFAAEESCRNPPQDMVLRDSLLYCAEMNEFQVFNVARPRQPVRVGSCGLSATGRNVALRDTIAYVAMGSSGLVCIDVSDFETPVVIGSWGGRSSGVSVTDTIAYVAGPYTGLVSLNVSDPSSPRVIDSLYLSDTLWWNDVTTSGSRAYVGGERVLTVDVSDPADLRVRGSLSPPYLVQRLAYSPPYLYAACLEAGVCILESTAVGVDDKVPRLPSPEKLLQVEPNPAHNIVLVNCVSGKSSVSVFDAIGRDVSKRVRFDGDAGPLRMGIEKLPTGLYFVCEGDKEVRNVAKFVKQ